MRSKGAAILLFFVLAACGASRQTILSDSLTALNAARDAFQKWDSSHQAKLVEASTTEEDGVAALKEYRAKRENVVRAFTLAYAAIATAAVDLTADSLSALAKTLADMTVLLTNFETEMPSHV